MKSLTSAADGTVSLRVLSSKPASWSLRFPGTDAMARGTSAVVRTVPKYAMRVVVPASGIGSARGYLKRGVTFALVKTGHLHGALLRGPTGERIHVVPAMSVVRTRTTGYFSARVSMPGGGTLIVW